jgi:pyruvate carboxylase
VIEGSPIPFTDDELAKTTDWARVKKIYKLNAVASAGAAGGGGKRGARGAAAAAAAAAAANVAANDTAAVAGTENVVVTEVVDEKKELEVGILGMMTLRGVS